MKINNLMLPLIALSALNPMLGQGLPVPINENDMAIANTETSVSQSFQLENSLAFTATELTELKEIAATSNFNYEILKRDLLEKRGIVGDILSKVRSLVDRGVNSLIPKANYLIDRITDAVKKIKAKSLLERGLRLIREKNDVIDGLIRDYEGCRSGWRGTWCRTKAIAKIIAYGVKVWIEISAIISSTIAAIAAL